MADFNRGNRFSRGGGGEFKKRDFNDRGSRRSVEMHKAVCDNCGNECEVPFRPTSGKPVFCSNCFEKNRRSDSPRPNLNYQQPNYNQQFETLNTKLDRVLKILESAVSEEPAEEMMVAEEIVEQPVVKEASKVEKKKAKV